MPPRDTGEVERAHYFPGGERFAFFFFFVWILYLAYETIRPLLVVLLFAGAVASLLHGPEQRLVDALGGRRRIAAVLSVALLLGCVLVPLTLLVFVGAERVVNEVGPLQNTLDRVRRAVEALAPRLGRLGDPLLGATRTFGTTLKDEAPELAHRVGEFASTLGEAVLHLGIAVFFFAISLYYFLVDGEAWRERVIDLVPIPARYVRGFFSKFRQVSVAVIVGHLGTAAIQSTVAGIGYLGFGVPAPFLWAVLTLVASFIPAIGNLLVFFPLFFWLGLARSWPKAILFLLYFLFVVGLIDNVVRPIFIRRGIRMHPLMVFLSVFGGLAHFGASGIFLGPLVMALAIAALDIYEQEPPSDIRI